MLLYLHVTRYQEQEMSRICAIIANVLYFTHLTGFFIFKESKLLSDPEHMFSHDEAHMASVIFRREMNINALFPHLSFVGNKTKVVLLIER